MSEISLLEGIGLSKGEIKVYFALLEIGSSTTGDIIKRAKVSRSKVYEMLERLQNRGLVSSVIKENTNYYEAADPTNIVEYVEKQKKEFEKKEQELKKILPILKQKKLSAKAPQTATVYEGIKGIKTLYNDLLETLNKGEEYYVIAVDPIVYKANNNKNRNFRSFIIKHHLKRAKKKIKVKLLAHQSIKKEISSTIGKTKLASIKYFTQSLPSATLIYRDNVATFVWAQEPVGMVMRSPAIAKRYKQFFKGMWMNIK